MCLPLLAKPGAEGSSARTKGTAHCFVMLDTVQTSFGNWKDHGSWPHGRVKFKPAGEMSIVCISLYVNFSKRKPRKQRKAFIFGQMTRLRGVVWKAELEPKCTKQRRLQLQCNLDSRQGREGAGFHPQPAGTRLVYLNEACLRVWHDWGLQSLVPGWYQRKPVCKAFNSTADIPLGQ